MDRNDLRSSQPKTLDEAIAAAYEVRYQAEQKAQQQRDRTAGIAIACFFIGLALLAIAPLLGFVITMTFFAR